MGTKLPPFTHGAVAGVFPLKTESQPRPGGGCLPACLPFPCQEEEQEQEEDGSARLGFRFWAGEVSFAGEGL